MSDKNNLKNIIRRNKVFSILLGGLILFYTWSVFTGWAWFNFVDSEKNTDPHTRSYNHK